MTPNPNYPPKISEEPKEKGLREEGFEEPFSFPEKKKPREKEKGARYFSFFSVNAFLSS